MGVWVENAEGFKNLAIHIDEWSYINEMQVLFAP
jgi:hypothetical protein